MSDAHEIKVQPPSDKQPVIDVKTGCWTKYGQRQQWDLWKRTGGFTDGVWEALIAGLIGSTQFSAIFNQFEAMQTELAELRTELAARQSYDDQIEELRIQLASVQQISENIVQQQESTRQEIEAREELQVARQAAANGGFEARQWASVQAIADTDQTVANLTTTNIPEGSRLYYTDARARLAFSATGDISYNNTTGVISYSTPANSATATKLATARNIAISGDIAWNVNFDGSADVTSAGTLASVNADVGSFGGSSSVPNFTVNGKGLITAAGSTAVVAPAGTLTGTTLAAGVTASSLTSVGTLTSLTVSGNANLNICLINGAAGTNRLAVGRTSGVNRWLMYLGNSTAEGGADAGSNFQIDRHSDAGVALGTPLRINRASGLVTLSEGLAVGTYTASALAPVTGYITIKDAGGTNRNIAVV